MKAIVALLAALLCTLAPAGAETLRFALIGDTPYSGAERRLLPPMLETIAAAGSAFVIHVGDFKGGTTACTDALFEDRLRLFAAAPLPFVYVPGDNEWTDCHRTSNGGYDPLERLFRLRQLFFPSPRSLGRRTITVERHSGERPEHLLWRAGPALFVTLNVPGADNNWGMKSSASAEHRRRMPEVLAWLRSGFARARRERVPVIVIAMQANPDFKSFASGSPQRGFRELLEALREETLNFAGAVVLVHGDTHWQRTDQPLVDPVTHRSIVNFTRVETHGSPFMGWVAVTIDTEARDLIRFEAHPFDSGNPVSLP